MIANGLQKIAFICLILFVTFLTKTESRCIKRDVEEMIGEQTFTPFNVVDVPPLKKCQDNYFEDKNGDCRRIAPEWHGK